MNFEMVFHHFNTATGQMFIVTPTDGVPIDHLKRIVDHYYKFKGNGAACAFDPVPAVPLVPETCES
ncbi:MAG: hypothetical protein KKH61_20535 [Gammaproteobacteria bacterium]|nr:hypothetical protein [Gammaproteobacteria bacterium]